jgi:hypothetical protein
MASKQLIWALTQETYCAAYEVSKQIENYPDFCKVANLKKHQSFSQQFCIIYLLLDTRNRKAIKINLVPQQHHDYYLTLQ